jgi:hypothetical protein
MSRIKTLSAVAVLVVATAAPAFAKAHIHHRRVHQWDQQTYYGQGHYGQAYYGQGFNRDARRNIEDFGFSGIDHSRVGGEDAWLHPAGK